MRPTLVLVTTLLAAATAFAEPPPIAAKRTRSEEVTGPIDWGKQFNIDSALAQRNTPGKFQSTKSAVSKEFYIPQKVAPKTYETRDFSGKKQSWFASLKFWAKDAPVKGKYEIPNAAAAAPVKTAPTKDAREATKTAATRELVDAHRPYLGKEAEKLNRAIDPNDQPRWTNDLRELKTIEDVKAMLNKN